MKKTFITCIIAGLICLSCSKEVSHNINPEDLPDMEVQGEDSASIGVLSTVEKNEHSLYSFGGVAGLYFGCTSSFQMHEKGLVDITFGTELTTNLKVTDVDFEKLIHQGDRDFGSLGSFSSFPRLDADRVEIAYTDKNSKRWCSTRIEEKQTEHGIEATVKIDQEHSSFRIDNIRKMNTENDAGSYQLKGHFECYLYEVNGNAKMKIKGHFQGLVSINVQ